MRMGDIPKRIKRLLPIQVSLCLWVRLILNFSHYRTESIVNMNTRLRRLKKLRGDLAEALSGH